jgi:hypothetical protein
MQDKQDLALQDAQKFKTAFVAYNAFFGRQFALNSVAIVTNNTPHASRTGTTTIRAKLYHDRLKTFV